MPEDRYYIVTAAVAAALIVVYALQVYYQAALGTFVNAATPVFALAAAVTAYMAAARYGLSSKQDFAVAWKLFFVGTFAWFVAEATWSAYVLVLNVPVPYPSLADYFFILGYVFFGAGLVYYVRVFSQVIPRANLLASGLLIAVAAALVSFLLIGPVLSSPEGALGKAFDLMYPILDLLLFSGAVLGFSIFRGGKLGGSWLMLNLAIVLDVVADVLFSYMAARGTYHAGSIADFFYLWSYLVFALAFFLHTREL